jgi:hypothetical protein
VVWLAKLKLETWEGKILSGKIARKKLGDKFCPNPLILEKVLSSPGGRGGICKPARSRKLLKVFGL